MFLMVPSSVAEPVKVTGWPGTTVKVWGTVGGVTVLGEVIDTTGAWAVADTIHERSVVSSELWPPVSLARICAFQVPSSGTVISFCHVVLVAPGTSGEIW